MIDRRTSANRWLAWPLWALGSGVGAGGGFLLAAEILKGADVAGYPVMAEPVIFGVLGAGAGTAQAIVWWRSAPTAIWWVLASSVGSAAIATLAAHVDAANLTSPILGFGVMGLSIGGLQWPILRRHVRWAGCWPLVSALGWTLGALVVFAFANSVALPELAGVALLFAAAVGVSGIVTGLALVWLSVAR
jgi:hypothetical protein